MELKVKSWWDKLSEKEKEILIELLYDLELENCGVITDEEGNYIGLNKNNRNLC